MGAELGVLSGLVHFKGTAKFCENHEAKVREVDRLVPVLSLEVVHVLTYMRAIGACCLLSFVVECEAKSESFKLE